MYIYIYIYTCIFSILGRTRCRTKEPTRTFGGRGRGGGTRNVNGSVKLLEDSTFEWISRA